MTVLMYQSINLPHKVLHKTVDQILTDCMRSRAKRSLNWTFLKWTVRYDTIR